MKETRIPYSIPMARARRAGLKKQTRRVVKPQPVADASWAGGWVINSKKISVALETFNARGGRSLIGDPTPCPYGQPGDILLPVEPWRAPVEFDAVPPRDIPAGTPVWLDANGPAPEGFGRYRHARFMPRHLIQARDELVAVRVERLQEISEADCRAEGLGDSVERAHHWYRVLWEQINGPGSWDDNPLVWVVEFRVLKP